MFWGWDLVALAFGLLKDAPWTGWGPMIFCNMYSADRDWILTMYLRVNLAGRVGR